MSATYSKSESPSIIYVVPHQDIRPHVISANIGRRKKVMESLGFTVHLIGVKPELTFLTIRRIRKRFTTPAVIVLRIDGACHIDSYTVLKLFFPKTPLIWELHGFPEEQLTISHNFSTRARVYYYTLRRLLLSFFVNACISVSKELEYFAKRKIIVRTSSVIPNFVEIPTRIDASKTHIRLPRRIFRHIVLWGGSGELPWQGLDLIQNAADIVESKNPKILFLLVSSDYWFKFRMKENIVLMPSLSPDRYQQLVAQTDFCLALYRPPDYFPFYFCPMKILDSMALGKPVIASRLGMIPEIVTHGYNGLLTDNDPQEIAKLILSLAHNTHLLRQMSRNARQTVYAKYNQQKARQLYGALFKSLRAAQ